MEEAFEPAVERVQDPDQDGDFDKFGGLPSVAPAFVWPVCGSCALEMQFFFQLTRPGGQTFQMFQCITGSGRPDEGALSIGCKCNNSALYYIDYATHSIANVGATQRAQICAGAYDYSESDHEQYGAWLNNSYLASRPYQCFRVTNWLSAAEPEADPDPPRVYFGPPSAWCVKELHGDPNKYVLHISDAYFLPYMWGDAGRAHINTRLELAWQCS